MCLNLRYRIEKCIWSNHNGKAAKKEKGKIKDIYMNFRQKGLGVEFAANEGKMVKEVISLTSLTLYNTYRSIAPHAR